MKDSRRVDPNLLFRGRRWPSYISRKDYGYPSERFENFCDGSTGDDCQEEYARRLIVGFRIIGEEIGRAHV